ncbi:hypothetical protein MP228_008191 [Amoeboaphelidium protococcarum]|nr:hypothetical protein MP228_008191 [Amoeboaphelidium protococcarum]
MWERWLDFLLQFDFDVIHISRHQNVIADALSRKYEKWKLGRKCEVQEGHRVSRLDLMLAEDFILRRLPQSEIDGKVLDNETERRQLLKDVHDFGLVGTDCRLATIIDVQLTFGPFTATVAPTTISLDTNNCRIVDIRLIVFVQLVDPQCSSSAVDAAVELPTCLANASLQEE